MPFPALYDMGAPRALSTYDFFTWLVHEHTRGATEIVFQVERFVSTKWPVAEAKRRFENYIRPGPDLIGLPSRIGTDGDRGGSHQVPDLMALGKPFKRLTSVFAPASERYTVTLRNTFHNTGKNSDQTVWREFASRIGAHVIEDTADKHIGLYERMALYAGAAMNFGVTNGPMSLCSMSPYPVTIWCDPATTAKGFGGHNIKVGEQYPYALPGQRLVWEKPTLEGLMRHAKELGI